MKLFKKNILISIMGLLVFQFACDDNGTGFKDNPVEEWYGQLSVDVVKSILKLDGTVWSWGFNGSGTIGNGTTEDSDVPTKSFNLSNIVSIDQSYGAAVAADKNGDIFFWGNLEIYLGPPDIDTNVVIPYKITQLNGVQAITMSAVFIFLLRNDNTIWYIKMDWYSPQIVEGPTRIEETTNVKSIWKNLAVTSDGKIYDLFSKNYLQSTLTNIVLVSGSPSRHVVSLKQDGTLWAWGQNDLGQLGNGTYENSNIPIKVLNLNDIISVSTNYDYNLALRKDGTIWFWGYEGQEGDTLISRNIPIKIEGISDAVLICSGFENLVMTKDGTYWHFNSKDKIPQMVSFN